MKRRSIRRTSRYGYQPLPDNVMPYRDWCDLNDLNPETENAWNSWMTVYGLKDMQ
ncbi:MAG: hypothetical protein RLY50_34 [Actinomycetota bacterium]|jgi:hypothetical protein